MEITNILYFFITVYLLSIKIYFFRLLNLAVRAGNTRNPIIIDKRTNERKKVDTKTHFRAITFKKQLKFTLFKWGLLLFPPEDPEAFPSYDGEGVKSPHKSIHHMAVRSHISRPSSS